jgi:ElaB/YqjD/DUF883 family membrane-anchored ribosome-binding protein
METYFNRITPEDGTMSKFIQDLRILMDDAELLVKAAGGNLAEISKDEFLAGINKVRERCRALEQHALAGAKATDQIVRSNPYASIGVAFGLGLLLGVLTRRD